MVCRFLVITIALNYSVVGRHTFNRQSGARRFGPTGTRPTPVAEVTAYDYCTVQTQEAVPGFPAGPARRRPMVQVDQGQALLLRPLVPVEGRRKKGDIQFARRPCKHGARLRAVPASWTCPPSPRPKRLGLAPLPSDERVIWDSDQRHVGHLCPTLHKMSRGEVTVQERDVIR